MNLFMYIAFCCSSTPSRSIRKPGESGKITSSININEREIEYSI